MAALHQLPFESLVQILSSLSTGDLIHTSLVCRRLSEVSQLLLYRSPTLSMGLSPEPVQSLGRFIQTLVHSGRRDLASHVRSVGVSWGRSSRLDHTAYPTTVWPSKFHHTPGFHGIHCVLLLHILPSLHELHVTPPLKLPDVSSCYLSHCLEAPHGDPGTPTLHLQSLRKFTSPYAGFRWGIPYPTGHGGISFGAVLALMRLPSLESIETYIHHFPDLPPPGTTPRVPFSRINDLRISMSTLSPPSLAVLLRAPIALRRFSCVTLDYSILTMANLSAALSPLRASLEHLQLGIVRAQVSVSSQNADIIRESWRLWPALHTLQCSMRELIGYPRKADLALAEVLPRGLRRLEIATDQYWMYDDAVVMVGQLLGVKGESVPLLRCVAMDGWSSCDDGMHELLRRACVEAGVELVPNGSGGW